MINLTLTGIELELFIDIEPQYKDNIAAIAEKIKSIIAYKSEVPEKKESEHVYSFQSENFHSIVSPVVLNLNWDNMDENKLQKANEISKEILANYAGNKINGKCHLSFCYKVNLKGIPALINRNITKNSDFELRAVTFKSEKFDGYPPLSIELSEDEIESMIHFCKITALEEVAKIFDLVKIDVALKKRIQEGFNL